MLLVVAQSDERSNGIVERLHRTLLDERFRVEGRRTWFETIDEMQIISDDYLVYNNEPHHHQGCGMNDRTRTAAFVEDLRLSQQRKEGQKVEKQAAEKVAWNCPLIAALSADCSLNTRVSGSITAGEAHAGDREQLSKQVVESALTLA